MGRKPVAILATELRTSNVPLRGAWIGKLKEARDISHIMGKLGRSLPAISHLKRCSAKRLVLAFAMDSKEDEKHAIAGLTKEDIEVILTKTDIRSMIEEIELCEVPATAARTKAQAREASQIWPLNFHPDPILERILDGTCFNEEQMLDIEKGSKICDEIALRVNANKEETCYGGAAVYDPKTRLFVAVAASRTDLHPLYHPSMIAVDLVAKFASGGAYKFWEDDDEPPEEKRPKLQDFPLAFPDEIVEIARELPYNDSRPVYTYLCTDYWIFLSQEACPLCAMALLHSRFTNIFYNDPNKSLGVLSSRAILQQIPGLNHRYGVWQCISEQSVDSK